MANITIVGGAGAIGRVHAFLLAADGHTVTILDSRLDGEPGSSYLNLTRAEKFRFVFPEITAVRDTLHEEGTTVEEFKALFNQFPDVFKKRAAEFAPETGQLSQKDCLNIIEEIISLPLGSIHLAQSSKDIRQSQDIIVVTVKGAALNKALANKINDIPQAETTPVVVYSNGIMPWTMPELGFGGLRLESIGNCNEFVDSIKSKIKIGGVLIKYGAAPVDNDTVCMRSSLFDAQNIITTATAATTIAEMYTNAGLNTTSTPNIMPIILDKLNYNLTGSIMGAIFNCKMGDLVSNEKIKIAVENCAGELFNFAAELGVQLALTENDFIIKTVNALHKNKNVISSPLQDVRAGRPTEKDFLVKATIEWAQQHGMEMPVLKSMYALISMVEKKSCKNTSEGENLQAELVRQMEQSDIVSIAEQYGKRDKSAALIGKHVLAWMTKTNKKVSEPNVAALSVTLSC